MPELPEIETIRLALDRLVIHRIINKITLIRQEYLECGLSLCSSVSGGAVESVERRGKFLAIHLNNQFSLLHHLGMSGRLILTGTQTPLEPHTHIRILLDDGSELRQSDPRRFGFVAVFHADHLLEFPSWKQLGCDPFQITVKELFDLMQPRKKPVKNFLLDQHFVAGLGNIYVDESLFRAQIHPLSPCGDISLAKTKILLRHIQAVLAESIAAGGSSTSDYQKLDGTFGEFQKQHRVYRRTGEPCYVCGNAIDRMVLGGRSTHYCPHCQER